MLVCDSLLAEVLQGCDTYVQFVTISIQVVSCRYAICNLHLKFPESKSLSLPSTMNVIYRLLKILHNFGQRCCSADNFSPIPPSPPPPNIPAAKHLRTGLVFSVCR